MKRHLAFFFIIVLVNMYQHINARAVSNYLRQHCDEYKYEILVPAQWQHDEITLSNKHIFVSFYNDAEIKVRAFFFDENNIQPIIWKRKWNLRDIDPLLHEIIEIGNIRIKENIRDSLLVFEFRTKNKKVLQRTMICKKGNIVYIVDCKAPVRIFYTYENHFNVAFSSFKIIGENNAMQRDIEAKEENIQNSKSDTKENVAPQFRGKNKNYRRNKMFDDGKINRNDKDIDEYF